MAYRGSQLWNENDPTACAKDENSAPVARAARWKGNAFVRPTPETAIAIRELNWKTDLDLRGEDECHKSDQLPLLDYAPHMQLKRANMLTYVASLQGRWEDTDSKPMNDGIIGCQIGSLKPYGPPGGSFTRP